MITVWAPDGVGEVRRGDDLADLLLPLVELRHGDIVCVTSKVVSKAEGRVVAGSRVDAVAGETRRLVAQRGDLAIVVNRLGLIMAAAGVDASNIEPGHVVLLPDDPDASAGRLRASLLARASVNVGVLVTDTAGRAWRTGQTDMAIGAAGLVVVDDHTGRADAYGNELRVTAPAVADELAGAAELAASKLGRRPFAVIRGRDDLVLAPGEDGPGAAALVRPAGEDLFGYGSHEAVVAALAGRPEDRATFGDPVDAETLAAILAPLTGGALERTPGEITVTVDDPRAHWVAEVASYAHGWVVAEQTGSVTRLRPATT